MAVKKVRKNLGYGIGNPLQDLAPLPIIATRAPTTSDIAEIGCTWVNKSSGGSIYVLQRVANGSATWSTSPAAGATTLASLIVTGASDLQGNVTVGGTLGVTGATTVTDLSVSGAFNLGAATGQIDFTTSYNGADAITLEATAGGIDILATGTAGEDIDIIATGSSVNIRATEDVADAIYIRANGGTSETVRIHSDQGTGAASVHLESDVGGVTLTSGLASADAINLSATAGGVDIDGALQVNIASSQNAVDAIRIVASAGGIDIDAVGAATEDINITNTGGSIVLSATESAADSIKIESTAGGIDILASGAAAGEDIDIIATGSSVNINSTENAADSVVISSTNGGIDITASSAEDIDISGTGGVNISSTENAAGSVTISNNGGVTDTIAITNTQGTGASAIDLNAIAGGVAIDAAGAISLDAAAASNFTTSGAGVDIDIASGAGRVIVTAGENAADAIYLRANAGISETVRIHSDQGTGVASVHLESDVGGITLTSGLASADAINLSATAGGLDFDGALQVNIASSQAAAANSVRIVASAADGGIDVDSGTGGLTLDSTGAISIDSAAASNFTITGAGDLSLIAGTSSVVITGAEAAVDAIDINASNAAGGIDVDAGTGGITIDTTGALSLDSAAASNFTITGAGDLTLAAGTSSVVVSAAEAVIDAIQLTASNAAGGVKITTGTLAATTGINLVQGAANASIQVGAGVPAHSAPKGTLYLNTTGSSTSTRAYINTDAATTWTAITTAA